MFDLGSSVMQSAIANILRAQRPDLPEEIDALFTIVKHYQVQLEAIHQSQLRVEAILEKQYGRPEQRNGDNTKDNGPDRSAGGERTDLGGTHQGGDR